MKEETKIKQMAQSLSKIAVRSISLLREIADLLDVDEEDISERLDLGMIPKTQRRIDDLRISLKDIERGLEMIFRASLPIIAHEEEWKNESSD